MNSPMAILSRLATGVAALALVATPLTAFAHEDAPHLTQSAPQSAGQGRTERATSTTADARLTDAKDRATREIDRRVAKLNALAERINKMERLTAAQKAALTANLTGQVRALEALKTDVAGQTEAAGLRALIKTLAESYQVYSLVLPQISILAAANRVLSVVEKFSGVVENLEARIVAVKGTGDDVSELETWLGDLKAKVAGAKQKADDAIAAVSNLKPGVGNGTARETNRDTLKDAHAKLRAAQQDLVAARKLAGDIDRGIKALMAARTATTTSAE